MSGSRDLAPIGDEKARNFLPSGTPSTSSINLAIEKQDEDPTPSSQTDLDEKIDDEEDAPEPAPETRVVPPSPSPPPNGGLAAWLQVLGSFMLFFNTWGLVNAFGVYQTYYHEELLSDIAPSTISWIGSIQAFLLLLVGVITGPLFDMGYFRHLIFTGSVLVFIGQLTTSWGTQFYQLFLAQGLCIGIGSGCLFVPSVAIIPQYFSTKKALATGIAASGSSLAGIIYPIVFHRLQPQIGFPWATRVIAFIMLGTQAVALVLLKIRLPPTKKTRALYDPTAVREIPFILTVLAFFVGFIGIYIPIVYVPTYASFLPDFPQNLDVYLIAIINAASTFGRILPNYVADKVGPMNVLFPCALAAAVLAYAWLGITSLGGMIVFCILYGFFTGSFVSLPPTAVVTLTKDLGLLGTRLGMMVAICAIGLLIGTPVAGAILGDHARTVDDWLGIKLFCACVIVASAVSLLVARVSIAGWKLKVKA